MTRSGKTCRVVCNAVSRFSDSRPAVGRLSPGSRSSACTSASCGQPSDRPRPSVSASLRRCGPQASGRRDVRNRSAQPLSAGFAPARKPFENRQARFLPDFQARIAPKITVLYTNGKICAKEHKSHFAFYALLLSHPTRGAWIEIFQALFKRHVFRRRTLPGVRGLKLLYHGYRDLSRVVAPYPGCVD